MIARLVPLLGIALWGGAARGEESSKDVSYREQIATTVDAVARARDARTVHDPKHAVAFRTGYMSFQQGGVAQRQSDSETEISFQEGANVTNAALEWQWFHAKDLNTFMGYRGAFAAKYKRTQYQAGYGGVRYFLYNPGITTTTYREFTTIRYDSKFRPYVEGGMSLGRYLIHVFGDKAALDVSSEFYGASVGIGTEIPVSTYGALSLAAVGEYAKGYGPILFSATTFFGQLGMTYYY